MFFSKMHGLGNDFIVINDAKGLIKDIRSFTKAVCDRHFGIGADGVLVVEKSDCADAGMTIINSDGSIAEMCGNGIRCFCKYLYEKEIVKKDKLLVETQAGILEVQLTIEKDVVTKIRVNMGEPIFNKNLIPFKGDMDNMNYKIAVNENEFNAATLLMGVPHTILYVNNITDEIIETYGKIIEHNEIFPRGTNVNFVKIINEGLIEIRTWERGAGYTLACGTGACASGVACIYNNKTKKKLDVLVAGGKLNIEYEGDSVFMEGPAEFICEGQVNPNILGFSV